MLDLNRVLTFKGIMDTPYTAWSLLARHKYSLDEFVEYADGPHKEVLILVVAMFSDTYALVQAESLDLWHKQNYGMLRSASEVCLISSRTCGGIRRSPFPSCTLDSD